MKPYYQTEDGSIRIFHAQWEDVLAAGVFAPKDIALIHADPPYGVNEKCDRRSLGRGKLVRLAKDGRFRTTKGLGKARDWSLVVGDDKPFNPAPLLALKRPLVTWGANYYASKLPDVSSWLAWDKRDFVDSDNNADQELAWTNLGGPLRTFRHLWRGLCRASESGSTRVLHPTQKPEALSEFVFAHAEKRKKLKRGDTVLVPYMGSFPDARPAIVRGYKVIACEVAEEYCKTAVNARLRAVAREENAEKLGPLFALK